MILVNTVLMVAPYAVAVTHETPSSASAAPPVTAVSMFDGIWSIPNAITLIRLMLLPVFLYVLFGLDNRAAASLLLGLLSSTDWVDGYLARRLGQVSEFGKVFDPTVDRLLFVVATTAIVIDGSIPLWFAVAVLVREVLVGLMMVVATVVFKMPRIDVTYWGKLATFLLMFAVPGFLMGNSGTFVADGFQIASWLVGIPGLILSYWTAIAYIPQVRRAVATGSSARLTSLNADS
jgi:cardiolipin synthase